MSDVVEYVLRLKDEMSGGLKSIEKETNALNKTVKMVGGAIAGYFAVSAVKDFVTESVQGFQEQQQAIAQVNAGLKSMGGASGQTIESLSKYADNKMNASLYDDDEILKKVSSTLLTFGSVTGDTFNKAQDAAVDLSAKFGTDLQGATIQLGKALQDPIKGVSALSRVGVSFSDTQKTMIKTLVDTGQSAKAQQIILDELKKEVGGAAQAAYDALSPFEKFQKQMKPFQDEVGGAAVKLQEKLLPYMLQFLDILKDLFHWVQENKTLLEGFAIVLIILAAPMIAAAIAGWALEAALLAINVVANLNPFMLIATGIILFIFYLKNAYEKSAVFRANVDGLIAVFKSFAPILKATGELLVGAFTFNPAMITKGIADFKDGLKEVANIGETFDKAKNASLAASQAAALKNKAEGATTNAPKDTKKDKKIKTVDSNSKVTGSKNTTINISIQKFIDGGINISTTTIKESASEMQTAVARALTNAVNDAQIIATQ